MAKSSFVARIRFFVFGSVDDNACAGHKADALGEFIDFRSGPRTAGGGQPFRSLCEG